MLAVVFKVLLEKPEFCSIQKQSRTGHQLFPADPADAFLKSSNLSHTTASLFGKTEAFFRCAAHVFGVPLNQDTQHEKLRSAIAVV